METLYRLSLLACVVILLAFYWMDVRPILRGVGRPNETGRYQLVVRADGTFVLDTQQGKIYALVRADDKPQFISLDLLVGKVQEMGEAKLSK